MLMNRAVLMTLIMRSQGDTAQPIPAVQDSLACYKSSLSWDERKGKRKQEKIKGGLRSPPEPLLPLGSPRGQKNKQWKNYSSD